MSWKQYHQSEINHSHQCDMGIVEVVPFHIILRFDCCGVMSITKLTKVLHKCIKFVGLILIMGEKRNKFVSGIRKIKVMRRKIKYPVYLWYLYGVQNCDCLIYFHIFLILIVKLKSLQQQRQNFRMILYFQFLINTQITKHFFLKFEF